MMLRLALLCLVLTLAACRSLISPERPPNPQAAATSAAPESAAPIPQAPPPTTRQYRLGNAASALVTQAHARAAAGDYPAAIATLERALRIEPENPLTWIELGQIQLAASNPAQADSMGHKALALATGDTQAQASAWRLIADSLRSRRRNEEAAVADKRANTLSAQ
jgi:tetratricopeptide (TPR) repeat protein